MPQSKLIPVADYLARAANARVVYKHLFDSAVLTLPLMLTEGDNVECYYTLTDIADALPWTKSQIANELRLLSNFGWLQTRKGSWRYLGRRDENGAFLLLADMAAFHTTGVERLISNRILEITLPAPEPTIENTKRGAAREWSGTQTQGGGELDLGT